MSTVTVADRLVVAAQRIAESGAMALLMQEGVRLAQPEGNYLLEAIDQEMACGAHSLETAMRDAREAVEAGMTDVAQHTFAATMRLCGFAAARRVLDAMPINGDGCGQQG